MARRKIPQSVNLAREELKQSLLTIDGKRFQGVYLYGSYARGDFSEGSDVDLLIALEGDVEPCKEIDQVNEAVSEISLRYDLLISVFPIPAEWLTERKSPLFENVRWEGIAL